MLEKEKGPEGTDGKSVVAESRRRAVDDGKEEDWA